MTTLPALPLTPLTALSPLDGRYQSRVAPLRALFSEWALIRFRVQVEIEWLKALAAEPTLVEVPPFSAATVAALDALAGLQDVAHLAVADDAARDQSGDLSHQYAAGRALEKMYAGRLEEVYDRLAYHYSKTNEAAKAVEYLTQVAAKATIIIISTYDNKFL